MRKIEQKIKTIEISKLHLWTENPRDPVNLDLSNDDIIKRAEDNVNNKWNLKKLVNKMGEYYDYSELPTVVYENGKYIVYDGNRRVAILKCIQNPNKYSKFIGKLFPEIEPETLRSQTSVPCNLCDKETALNNVERKHIDNSSWGQIERDYFAHYHRDKDKTLFLMIDEQTKLITNNKILNKRFVKEEVLTEKNLKNIGIFVESGILKSNYSESQIADIFIKIMNLIEKKIISTRNRRNELKKPLIENFRELKTIIDKKHDHKVNIPIKFDGTKFLSVTFAKKTRLTKRKDLIFGKNLVLEPGAVNDLYLAIDFIDKKTKNNDNALLVIGMSLRLILELSARIYYRKMGDIKIAEKDQVYKDFLKLAKGKMKKNEINFLSLTSDWLTDQYKLEALLSKYSHSNITPNRSDVLKMSCIVADILEYFFNKK